MPSGYDAKGEWSDALRDWQIAADWVSSSFESKGPGADGLYRFPVAKRTREGQCVTVCLPVETLGLGRKAATEFLFGQLQELRDA